MKHYKKVFVIKHFSRPVATLKMYQDQNLVLLKEPIGKSKIRTSYSKFLQQMLTIAGLYFIPEHILFFLF